MASTGGHVFVLRGDIRRLVACAWLLPTDAAATIEPVWTRPLRPPTTTATDEWFAALAADVDAERGRRFADSEWTRVLGTRSPGGALSVLTRTAVAHDHVDSHHLDRALREFASAALSAPCHVHHHDPAVPSGGAMHEVPTRRVPLLAVPTIGTGRGGGAAVKGEVLEHLLRTLGAIATDFRVDFAVVTRSAAAAAAMREGRRAAAHAAFDLDPALAQEGRDLARRVGQGEVVLFTGAGVGVPAGLPTWSDLLRRLDPSGVLDDDELAGLPLLDQAAIIERELDIGGDGGRQRLVQKIVAAVDRDHYALGHALLANLPIAEAATLNYDRLHEIAAADAGRRLTILPYQRVDPASAGWLLKLHGCVDENRREDIVLTREDYLSLSGHRAALTGLLQAMLVTRHMLFVGFGLGDDHFHAIVHDVRRALAGAGTSAASGDVSPYAADHLGTALVLRPSKAASAVWKRDLNIWPMGGDDPSRRLEIFLDLLANDSDQGWQHVLDPAYAGILSPDLVQLHDLLMRLAAAEPMLGASEAWPIVQRMLGTFGYQTPASRGSRNARQPGGWLSR